MVCATPLLHPHVEALLEAWTTRAESLLRQCQPAPACMAFLLDRLTDAVVAGIPELEGAEGGGAAAGGSERGAPLPHALASWLSGRAQVRGVGRLGYPSRSRTGADPPQNPLPTNAAAAATVTKRTPNPNPPKPPPRQDLLYDGGFLIDLQAQDASAGQPDAPTPKDPGALAVDDPNLAPALWLNLDGGSALVALNVRRGGAGPAWLVAQRGGSRAPALCAFRAAGSV
jgi:hypothetical protein